jgi:hypothetical protein
VGDGLAELGWAEDSGIIDDHGDDLDKGRVILLVLRS